MSDFTFKKHGTYNFQAKDISGGAGTNYAYAFVPVDANGTVITGGGGGGGAITAASGSYVSGALSAGAIVDLGTGATPGANTTNGILKTINTTLGTPLQAGGSVVATGNVASLSADSGNPVKVGMVYNSSSPAPTSGQRVDLQSDSRGNLKASITGFGSTVSMTCLASNTDAANPGGQGAFGVNFKYNGSTFDRDRKPNVYSRVASSTASGNPAVLKASAGDVTAFWGLNTTASLRYLQLYNKASAPTIGTDTPVLTYPINANERFSQTIPNGGDYFSTGIAYAFTTDVAASTGASAGDITTFAIHGA